MLPWRLIQKAQKRVQHWNEISAEAQKQAYFRARDLWVTVVLPIFVIVSISIIWSHIHSRETGLLLLVGQGSIVLLYMGLAVVLVYAHPGSVVRLCLFPLMAGYIFVFF